MEKRNAYTLIELIVTIAILAILVAMTVPNLGYFKSIREAQEIKELKRDILFARNKAILDCKDYGIEIRIDDNSYRIYSGLETIKIKYFKYGTKLNNKGKLPKILFKTNGTTEVGGPIYFLNRIGEEYKLTITPVTCRISINKN